MLVFHPADDHVHLQGVTSCTNAVLHGWLQQGLSAIVSELPETSPASGGTDVRATWERWQQGLSVKPTLASELPPLRMLLILDNLAGHKTPAFVLWLFAHGIMPIYAPVGGSWLNMTDSIQTRFEAASVGRPASELHGSDHRLV